MCFSIVTLAPCKFSASTDDTCSCSDGTRKANSSANVKNIKTAQVLVCDVMIFNL